MLLSQGLCVFSCIIVGSFVYRVGLKLGDEIIEVNGVFVESVLYE